MSVRRFRVEGRVQGVGFRWFVRERARALGLHGAVRNDAGGTVTAWATGDAEGLDRFAVALADGPPASRVARVESSELAEPPSGETFDVRF